MTREQTLQRIREAREACERGEPLSLAEIAEHRRRCAEEMARHETRQSDQGALAL